MGVFVSIKREKESFFFKNYYGKKYNEIEKTDPNHLFEIISSLKK